MHYDFRSFQKVWHTFLSMTFEIFNFYCYIFYAKMPPLNLIYVTLQHEFGGWGGLYGSLGLGRYMYAEIPQ